MESKILSALASESRTYLELVLLFTMEEYFDSFIETIDKMKVSGKISCTEPFGYYFLVSEGN